MHAKLKANFKALLAYFFIPVAIGLLHIHKVFFVSGLLAFDSNDEVGHTFHEVGSAWKALSEGTVCLINLFNNFGTPVIGDPIINPFAPQVISYLIFDGPLASTINRFVFVSLSVSLLTFFYRRYFSFSLLVSGICAVMLVLLPNFGYFFMHHPHQGVLLFFTLILIMQQEFAANPKFVNLLGLYLSLILFALGASNNGFLLGVPFILANQFFVSKAGFDGKSGVLPALLFSAVLLTSPHFASFFKFAALSSRMSFDLAILSPYTLKTLLHDLMFYGTGTQINETVFYSLPLILLAFIGLVQLRADKNKLLLWRVLLLGVAPFLVVLFLLWNSGVRASISFLKPLNITRIWWFSNVFFMIAAGHALQKIRERVAPRYVTVLITISFYFGLFYALNIFDYYAAHKLEKISGNANITAAILSLFFVCASVAVYRLYRARDFAKRAFILALLPLMLIFSHLSAIRLGMFDTAASLFGKKIAYSPAGWYPGWYSDISQAEFRPQQFLDLIAPYSRIAVDFGEHPRGYTMTVFEKNIFGSSARYFFLHDGFKKYLLGDGLINDLGLSYYISSADSGKLSLLGIRYLITARPVAPPDKEWKLLSEFQDELEGRRKYLYENQRKTSLGYLAPVNSADIFRLNAKSARYLSDNAISYQWNSIGVGLPRIGEERDLVMTFINWPGWKASVDGKPRDIGSSADHLLRIKVYPGERSAAFRFEPFSKPRFLISVVLAMVVFFAIALYAAGWDKKSRKKAGAPQ